MKTSSIDTIIFLIIAGLCARALESPSFENELKTNRDIDVYNFPADDGSKGNQLQWKHITGNYISSGRPYSAYFATFHPRSFSFYPSSPSGCISLVQTSVSSNESWSHCEYATNGAFFDTNAANLEKDNGTLCKGNLISSSPEGNLMYSQIPSDTSGTSRANFGISSSTRNIILGFLDSDTIANGYKFSQLVTGWGWVVRGGKSNVALSQDFTPTSGFVTEKAPRTAVGVMPNGFMCLLEIDGEEDINNGPDLYEQADLLVSLGVESAVNIDGGGSSVSVNNGDVIDSPTCNDTPVVCERAVANFACVSR